MKRQMTEVENIRATRRRLQPSISITNFTDASAVFLLPTMPVTMQNMPGANLKAYLMLPLRIVFTGTVVTIMYPLLLTAGYLRALYLRLVDAGGAVRRKIDPKQVEAITIA